MSDGDIVLYTISSLLKDGSLDWRKVAGLKMLKKDVEELAELVSVSRRRELKAYRLRNPRGLMFSGEPGCGKTFIARMTAKRLGFNLIHCPASRIFSPLPGHSLIKVKRIFDAARENTPCIIFIDEIDAIGTDRGIHNAYDGVLQEILTQMDGSDRGMKEVIVIAATNTPETLDKALVRSGRFDIEYSFNLPTEEERREYIELYTIDLPTDSLDIDMIVNASDGMSYADLKSVINRGSRTAFIEKRKIQTADIITAIQNRNSKQTPSKINDLTIRETIRQIATVLGTHLLSIKPIEYVIYTPLYRYRSNSRTIINRYYQMFIAIFGITAEIEYVKETEGVADISYESSKDLKKLKEMLIKECNDNAAVWKVRDGNILFDNLVDLAKKLYSANAKEIKEKGEELATMRMLRYEYRARDGSDDIKKTLNSFLFSISQRS